jgi:hypothetical protein
MAAKYCYKLASILWQQKNGYNIYSQDNNPHFINT